jgi:hypothetical protein
MHVSWRWLSLLTGVLIAGPARPGLLTAQQPVTITGRVTNDAGAPLSLASVYIETLGLGHSDHRGRTIPDLGPSRACHRSTGQPRRSRDRLSQHLRADHADGRSLTKDFTLAANPLRLGEVVVTGSGTSTTVEKLGNSINSVKSETSRNPTSRTSSTRSRRKRRRRDHLAGGRSRCRSSIIIRGLKTIQGDGQPLFVIDGQPIDNSTLKTSDFRTRAPRTRNRAADINPNDIESIEILKGGRRVGDLRCARGAGRRLITTKSGRAGADAYAFRSSSTMGRRQPSHPAAA